VGERLQDADREILDILFSKDLELTVQGMNSDTALGPNGFNVTLFKKMWHQIKKEI
jgi:hypothetical protein